MDREHILVVEDEEDIRELVRFNLAKSGYRVTPVESGCPASDGIGQSRYYGKQ